MFPIPYYELPQAGDGFIVFYPFAFFVILGVVVGSWAVQKLAEQDGGYDFKHLRGLMAWTAISGFVISHWFQVVAYVPEKIATDPLVLLRLTDGISSFGGLLGCATGFFWFLHKDGLKGKSRREYADVIILGAICGLAIGRIGCTVVRDHPGAPTSFPLGFDFGGGDVRHNLGLYDLLLYMVVIGLSFLVRAKWKQRPHGFTASLAPTIYASGRFFLDFLRTSKEQGGDERYFGLTPGHYMSMVMLGFALLTIRYSWVHRHDAAAGTSAKPLRAETKRKAKRRTLEKRAVAPLNG